MTSSLIDTHAHLMDERFDGDMQRVIGNAVANGVVGIIVVGYDVDSSARAVEIASAHEGMWATVGIHPGHAAMASLHALSEINTLARAPKVVAIGECGLDYFRLLSSKAEQKRAFEAQMDIAQSTGLPLIVHSRDAMDETIRILASQTPRIPGVMHCFDGTAAQASEVVALGMYVSVAGPITYRKDLTLATAVAAVPEDRLCIETDAPYLSPQGFRGSRNEPGHVRLIAEAVAAVRGMPLEIVCETTTANARRLFALPPEARLTAIASENLPNLC